MALSADRNLVTKPGLLLAVPVADNVKIYKGALVCYNTAGYAVPAADTASYVFAGVAAEQADNTVTGHLAGGIKVRVETGIRVTLPTTGATQASVGAYYYATDDQTIATTATNYVGVGQCVFYNSATSIDVEIPRGGGAALTSITGLTSTAAELNQLHSVTAGTTSASKAVVVDGSKNLDTLGIATSLILRNGSKIEFAPYTAGTYASTNTIDVTKSVQVWSVANGTSAASTWTPSAAGTAGDVLILITEADASGTVTVTFASTFHSSGTQATTASRFSSIAFISDGTRWVELFRTTALA